MQGTGVPSLVGEDPTCQGATMPVGHKTEPTRLKPLKNKKTDWNKRPSPQQDKPLKWEALSPQQNSLCSRQLEKAHVQQGRPSAAKDKYHFLKICYLLLVQNLEKYASFLSWFNVYYHMWKRSPAQVGCMRQGAWGRFTGMTLRDGMGREGGGGIRMGNTCKSMADSCQCMAKTTTIL